MRVGAKSITLVLAAVNASPSCANAPPFGLVACVLFVALMLAVNTVGNVPAAAIKPMLPLTDQSPAVRAMDVIVIPVAVVIDMAEPMATLEVITSPIYPAGALEASVTPNPWLVEYPIHAELVPDTPMYVEPPIAPLMAGLAPPLLTKVMFDQATVLLPVPSCSSSRMNSRSVVELGREVKVIVVLAVSVIVW